jgi:hypothetical protein
MALDPNIALGVRPLQLEMPNQLAQYAQISQIQNAQQANRLHEMQMAEYERARLEEEGTRNFLGKADLTDPAVRAQLLTSYGKSGREIYGKLSEAEKAQTEEAARRAKLMQDTQGMYRDMSGQIKTKADAVSFLQTMINDPAMKGAPITKIPLMAQVQKIPEDPQGLDDWTKQFAVGATKYVSENKPHWINANGANIAVGGLTGKTLPGIASVYDVPLPADVEAQKMRIANAGAARQVTNVNTQIPASEEAQKEFMKESRVTYNTLKNAPAMLGNMEEAKKLIPSAKSFMGPGGEPLLNAASFLNNRLGTGINVQGITDATELRSRLFNGVIENLRKLDAQPTQAQQQVLQEAVGSLGTDPNALPRVLDAFGGIVKDKVNLYNAEVTDAESRGVKFPYKPQIKLPGAKVPAADQIPGQGSSAPAARTVVRTGTLNGRRVIQYSDGSTEYGN